MTRDDEFKPRVGKIRARGSRRGQRYLTQVLRAIARAGGGAGGFRPRRSRFDGSRIGRGSGVGRVLRMRDRYAGYRPRRVVIKTRVVKLTGKKTDGARLHLRYIQRDGVTRDGTPGQLYDATHDQADGKTFLTRGDGDRHQFRFIVSIEDAAEYDDLKDVTRRLMEQVETDLGTQLDWVAVDHFNTGHPHTHIVLRGKDDRGKDLIIAREYIAYGMRERATDLVTLDLGPRTDAEIEGRLKQEVEQERYTSLDRRLVSLADDQGLVDMRERPLSAQARLMQSLRIARLQKLQRLGLASEAGPGRWRLSPQVEPTLRRMGEREDIIKTLHRAMTRAGTGRAASEYAIYDPADPRAMRVVGRVVERGLVDELSDRQYLVIDAADGRTHYVEIGRAEPADATPEGAIVAVQPKRPGVLQSDRMIAEIAAAHDGRYSLEIHLRHDPACSIAYAEAHVRRLEALRRTGVVERERDGTWRIPGDYLDRAAEFERTQARSRPVTLQILSPVSIDRLTRIEAATWLDRELVADAPVPLRDAGFGREVQSALQQRRLWLIEQELAEQQQDETIYRRKLLAVLRRRELRQVAAQLSGELGLPYAETNEGDRVQGTYRRRLDLVSGRFALVERSREFTLVPWRPVLGRHIGKSVGGIVRGDDVSWTIGRQRGRGIS
jgi:type IV secretory pathway VirD2 relaxase